MYPKCSLNSYSTYLQIFGLFALVIILIIAGIYYMRVYHKNILEKYNNPLELNSKEDKESQSGDRSTYPKNKYPGIGTSGDNKDKYSFRECKVYFTEDIATCDNPSTDSTIPKICSYTFDGWQEFDTYTDKNGKSIKYPQKIFNKDESNTDVSNTDESINSYFTNKCFKEFDSTDKAKPFEYSENKLVRHDSKGTQSDTEKDTNIFGGKKYTSIQFLSSSSPSDNFNDIINSICSVNYISKHSNLAEKSFYQFILNADNTLSSIKKVKLNNEQTGFELDELNGIAAVKDFVHLTISGLRINNNGKLEVFIKSSNISLKVKIYKFIYITNLCETSKIKDYTTKEKIIDFTNFLKFFGCPNNLNKRSPIEITNIDTSVLALTDIEKQKFKEPDVDYRNEIFTLIRQKIEAEDSKYTKLSEDETKTNAANIAALRISKSETILQIDNYMPADKTFLGVIKLKKEGTTTRIFDYMPGYINTNLTMYNIQDSVIYSGKSIFKFPHTGNTPQKEHIFIVPEGTIYYCDILLVGGGGAGGNSGGAGGGGDVLEFKNVEFKTGNYKILVGDGGNGKNKLDSCSCGFPGRPGNNTSITIGENTITAAGGGGGGSHCYEHSNDGGRGWVNSACSPSQTPTAKYTIPYTHKHSKSNPSHRHTKTMISSGGGGGTGNQSHSNNRNIKGGSGNTVSGNGGRSDDNNQVSGGAGGGAAPPSKGGNGGNSSIKGASYTGNGGKGIISSITGKAIEYGGGGAAGRWDGLRVNKNGKSSGGGGYQAEYQEGKKFTRISYHAVPMSGGGGTQSMRGASGVVIIKINSSTSFQKNKENIVFDDLYKKVPTNENQLINIPKNDLQFNFITSFVYLQKGFYRFRANIGDEISDKKFENPNIKSSWLAIYDESTLGPDKKYKVLKVFKYNDENIPSYLKPYLYIDKNKFYKLIYFYTANNISGLRFNLFYKYSITEPLLEAKILRTNTRSKEVYSEDSEDIITNPLVKSTIVGITDKYIMFTYSGLAGQTQYTFTTKEELNCDILIVAGGGAGGRNRFGSGRGGGGGGAGGLIFLEKQILLSGTYNITVGAGGNIDEGGNNRGEGFDGNNSSITGTGNQINLIAKGGGGGGTTFQDKSSPIGRNGGSGGGAGAGNGEWGIVPPGNGEAGQGFNGGGNMAGSWYGGAGAGGGGAGGYGWSWQNKGNAGAQGGDGKSITITEQTITYAKGGNGGVWSGTETPLNGDPNTGNGGDGANSATPGKGGSGIVIIRYRYNSPSKISKISEISKKSKNPIPNYVTINDSEKFNNDNDMYDSEYITDISDDMNSYLFSGNKNNNMESIEKQNSVYQHYRSKTMRDIFSTITYNNENAVEGKNFKSLAKNYLNLKSIDFFNIKEYDEKIAAENIKLNDILATIETNKNIDSTKKKLESLLLNIKGIDYSKIIGAPDACLKPGIKITNIGFSDDDKTYDKIQNIANVNLSNLNLVSTIYIEKLPITNIL